MGELLIVSCVLAAIITLTQWLLLLHSLAAPWPWSVPCTIVSERVSERAALVSAVFYARIVPGHGQPAPSANQK